MTSSIYNDGFVLFFFSFPVQPINSPTHQTRDQINFCEPRSNFISRNISHFTYQVLVSVIYLLSNNFITFINSHSTYHSNHPIRTYGHAYVAEASLVNLNRKKIYIDFILLMYNFDYFVHAISSRPHPLTLWTTLEISVHSSLQVHFPRSQTSVDFETFNEIVIRKNKIN